MRVMREERGAIMFSLLLGMLVTVGIAATVTVVSTSYYGDGEGFDFSNPLQGVVQDKVYVGKAVADMQAMGQASVGFFLKAGRYPKDIAELAESGYVDSMSMEDPWGNPWVYKTDGRHFILASYGSDGERGPNPPVEWNGEDTTPDLVMKDGNWLQVPKQDIKLKAIQESVDKQEEAMQRRLKAMEKAGVR